MAATEIEDRIGYRFRAPELLAEALRHGSVPTLGDGKRSYERLEFLGDSVLNLCIAHEMYRMLPLAGEGVLTKARAAVINNRNLQRVGERIGVPASLSIDPAVRRKGIGVTRKMAADAVEAIVGAIFLDGGYAAAIDFVHGHFRLADLMGTLVEGFDAKSRLQEWCQRERIPLPVYRLLSSDGPDHAREFRVEVLLAGHSPAQGRGSSKKDAEMAAAAGMISRLDASGKETL